MGLQGQRVVVGSAVPRSQGHQARRAAPQRQSQGAWRDNLYDARYGIAVLGLTVLGAIVSQVV